MNTRFRLPNAAAGLLRKGAAVIPNPTAAVKKGFSSLFSMLWPGQEQPYWKFNLISVLACAQYYHIDFLALPWQETQADTTLGQGGQSCIFQSAVSLKEEFAFKTSSPGRRAGGLQRIQDIYRELLVQVQIHGFPSLISHPNVVRLEALGWELQDPTALETPVWPVLIFEKTKYKSLEVFMDSETGSDLNLQQRLSFCSDIASALATMHAHNAFHLDLKPDNVLVFEAKDSQFLGKLSDFGLSKIVTGETNLRKSTMWSAPEHDEVQKYAATQLEKIETYMFGLVCVWILFLEQLKDLKTIETDVDVLKIYDQLFTDLGDGYRSDYLALIALKTSGNDKLLSFVNKCIRSIDCPSSIDLSFLNSILDDNPDKRSNILKTGLLSRRDRQETKKGSLNKSDNALFQIASDLGALSRVDFRVRNYIVSCLKTLAEIESTPEPQRKNAAFQVALCYRLGFGGHVDNSTVKNWLKKYDINTDDLDKKIEEIKSAREGQLFTYKRLQNLFDDHIITPINQATEFKKLKRYDQIEEFGRKEIQDMETVLDSKTHPAVMNLKWNLENILMHSSGDESSGSKLEEHLEGMIRDLKAEYGEESLEAAPAQGDLAVTYLSSGNVEAGEGLAKSTYELLRNKLGEEDVMTCLTAANLAMALDARFQTKAAKELLDTAVAGLKKKFGAEHPRTIAFKAVQARQNTRLGLFQEAIEQMEEVLSELPNIVAEDDEMMMTCKLDLIGCLEMAGLAGDAELKLRELKVVVEEAWKKGPNRHPPPDFLDFQIGSLLLQQEKFSEAIKTLYKLRPFDLLVSITTSWTRSPLPEGITQKPSGPPEQSSTKPPTSPRGYTPDDFPFNVQLVNHLILESTARQAQSQLDEDSASLQRARNDVGVVIGVLNKVLGKDQWPVLSPDDGIKGSYLQTVMAKGYCASLELLCSLGNNNARNGLHYHEAIQIATQMKLDHIVALLSEHQFLCGSVPDESYILDLDALGKLFTGQWSGHYLWTRAPGFRIDKFKGRTMSLSTKPDPQNSDTLIVTGTGDDDLGIVNVEGKVSTSGRFVLYFGLGDGEVSVGWEYSGTVIMARRAIGGTWSHRKSPVALGTFYFFAVSD